MQKTVFVQGRENYSVWDGMALPSLQSHGVSPVAEEEREVLRNGAKGKDLRKRGLFLLFFRFPVRSLCFALIIIYDSVGIVKLFLYKIFDKNRRTSNLD